MDKNRLIEIIVDAIQDKKGKDIVSLDLEGFDGAICSNFVVCNADSPTQVAAIADSIEEKVFVETGENPWRERVSRPACGWRSILSTWWYTYLRPTCAVTIVWRSCGRMRR